MAVFQGLIVFQGVVKHCTIVHREQLVIVGNLLANCLYLRGLVLRRARNLVVIAYLIV